MITELHPDGGGVDVIFDPGGSPAGLPLSRKPTSSSLSACASPQRYLGPLECDDPGAHAQRPGNRGRLASGKRVIARRLHVRSSARIDHGNPDAARQQLKQTYHNVGWRTEGQRPTECGAALSDLLGVPERTVLIGQ